MTAIQLKTDLCQSSLCHHVDAMMAWVMRCALALATCNHHKAALMRLSYMIYSLNRLLNKALLEVLRCPR